MDFNCSQSDASEIEAVSPIETPAIGTIFLIDSDDAARSVIEHCFQGSKPPRLEVRSSCTDILLRSRRTKSGCALIDPRCSGTDMLDKVCAALPVVLMTRSPTIEMVVKALQVGAVDFLEKPLRRERVLASISRARHVHRIGRFDATSREPDHVGTLTIRQRQVLDLLMAGLSNKVIAANLALSQRTVEAHRAAIMRKYACKSVARLVMTVCENKRFSGFHTA